MRSKTTLKLAALLVLSFATPVQAELSGYLKSLWLNSNTLELNTLASTEEQFLLGINRWRLEYRERFGSARVDVQYNHELRLGDYLRTEQYQLQQMLAPESYWHLQNVYHREEKLEARQGLYRATVSIPMGSVNARVGRQQINWARTFLWSSFDRFNPFDPLQIEADERPGVDGVLIRRPIDALNNIELAWAGQHSSNQQSYGLRWQQHWGETDWDFLLARFADTDVAGIALASQWQGAGVRLEATRNNIKQGEDYNDFVVSADYSFGNEFSVIAEALYRGSGADQPIDYDRLSLFTQRQITLAQRYLGIIIKQGFEPILSTQLTTLYNLDDHSYALVPNVSYSPGGNEDLVLKMGAQLFYGNSESEYGFLENLVFAELQWFY